MYHANLDKLKKFTKLKKLVLSNNYLNSFILLSKIECLSTVESIMIYDNEVLKCITIKAFVVYRFQHLKEVSSARKFHIALFFIILNSFLMHHSTTESRYLSQTAKLPNSSFNFLTKYCPFKTFLRRSLLRILRLRVTQRKDKSCVRELNATVR